jgi:diguanylate cyclase (GGDEF)-like protein
MLPAGGQNSTMQLDLLTLYGLAIGTLLVSATMTLWERQARPERSTELATWAGGYALLAAGCGLAIARTHLPGQWGWALSNVVILSGYLLILNGIGRVNGRRYGRVSLAILAVVALAWAAGGLATQALFWNYCSAFPIALACGLAARELLRDGPLRSMRSLPLPVAITAGHAIFYAFRSLVLPVLVAHHGEGILPALGEATLYEGVLYSVAMPMALLALVREEAQGHLFAASRTDYLTGLGNRQRFFEEGVPMLRRDMPVSLLAFDLDHFKAINDRWGHAAGDEVLKSFARVARETVGTGALLARIGGEEFAALLPGQDSSGAQQVGEAVARRLAATGTGDGGRIRATVSVGVAEFGVDGTDLTSLMSTADRALYAAKALGRNRTAFARPLALVTHG